MFGCECFLGGWTSRRAHADQTSDFLLPRSLPGAYEKGCVIHAAALAGQPRLFLIIWLRKGEHFGRGTFKISALDEDRLEMESKHGGGVMRGRFNKVMSQEERRAQTKQAAGGRRPAAWSLLPARWRLPASADLSGFLRRRNTEGQTPTTHDVKHQGGGSLSDAALR